MSERPIREDIKDLTAFDIGATVGEHFPAIPCPYAANSERAQTWWKGREYGVRLLKHNTVNQDKPHA